MTDFAALWTARYGHAPERVVDQLSAYLEHRSVRAYTDQPVDETTVAALVAAAQSASTSSNLQLYSMVSVQEPTVRASLNEHCGNQAQIANAPWFFAFCVDHHRLRHQLAELEMPSETLDYADYFLMGVVDASLAAERMVVAAESIGLGVCYIGALRNNPIAIRDLLHLPKHAFGLFGLCIGVPDETVPADVKPRLSQSAMWHRDRYDQDAGIGDYDERMAAFYASQNQDPKITWSMRSGRRLDEKYMSGRQAIQAFLQESGLNRR